MNHVLPRDGVLPRQDITEMVKNGVIESEFTIKENQFQPASFDLRLGEVGYRVQSSFLPDKTTVESKLSPYSHRISTVDLVKGDVLDPGLVYVIPLMERLNLPEGLHARCNPRSTTGRLDIFTRIITDHSDGFDVIAEGYKGPLYAEILSRSFPIGVRRGMSLSQIRFIRGKAVCSDHEIEALYKQQPLLYEGLEPISFGEIMLRQGLYLRVSLEGIGGSNLVGYKARKNRRPIDFDQFHHYDVLDFWEPVLKDSRGQLILERGEFYLLMSKEKVRIPPNYAAEMVAYEQGSGELRTHYAGFFDPGFGYGAEGQVMGTVAVMEVRALDAPFMVEDGQRFAKLQIEKMASTPDLVYGGKEIGSSYQFQSLTPSKHFRPLSTKEIKKRLRLPEQLSFVE